MGAVFLLDSSLARNLEISLGWRCASKHANEGDSSEKRSLRESFGGSGIERLRWQNRFDYALLETGHRFAAADAAVFQHPAFSSEVGKVKCSKCGYLCK